MKISLITVCFNSALFIAETLQSVDDQIFTDIEHIIVDGGSTDDTLKIIRSYPRPGRTFISESDAGVYDAMNKGIALATGEVVAFINSDDFYASNEILHRVAKIFENPSVDGCYGDICYIDRNDKNKVVRFWRSCPYYPGNFSKGWSPPHPSLFLRRNVFSRFGSFDLNYKIAADFEFMARVIEVHKIPTTYVPITFVKMRSGGISGGNFFSILRQNKEILAALSLHNLQKSILFFMFSKLISRYKQRQIRARSATLII